MMISKSRIVSATKHYDLLIEEGNDPFRDGDIPAEYMRRWDGPAFFEAMGELAGRDVLEVGVGTGRLARDVLSRGCRRFKGLDASLRTIERARENLLPTWPEAELCHGTIEHFRAHEEYDVVYSVLTMMHIHRKKSALTRMVRALRPGGRIVLSISRQSDWLEYGRRVRLHPRPPEYYAEILRELGCVVEPIIPLVDTFELPDGSRQPEYGQTIAWIVRATKPGTHV